MDTPSLSGAERLALGLYGVFTRLLTPVLMAKCWWRGRQEPAYRDRLLERLGWGPAQPGGFVWLHAVSLGETRAAEPLIQALREAHPGMRLLLTCSTATGWAAGEALLRPGDAHAWLPFDTPGACRRFLRRFQPRLGLLMETEVWPQLMDAAARQGLPMALVNARLSEKSLRQGLRWQRLLGPAVRRLPALAQSPADAERLLRMGAPSAQVLGNLKYDLALKPALLGLGRAWRDTLAGRPVVLAAIFREGEDAPLLAEWARLPPAGRPLLMLVPRHPQRFDEVALEVQRVGLSLSRRSGWTGGLPGPQEALADVWLGDSLGEMQTYAALSDLALLGGSFAPLGGHNLIELAACGCPVVVGPHTFNFAEAVETALEAGAAVRVDTLAQALALVAGRLADPAGLAQSRARAQAWAEGQQGATARTVVALAPWLD